MKRLLDYLRESSNVFIMYHTSPDPDAIGSAIALARILRALGKNVEVFKEKNMNEQVSAVVELSGETLVEKPSFNSGLLVVVDTSALSMINRETFDSFKGYKVAIDHHSMRDNYDGFDYVFVDDTAIATAILIKELAENLGVHLDETTARLLGIAMITDSANFIIGDARLFRALADILDIVDYQELMDIANMPLSFSERVARLKATSRLKLYFVDNYIIATTKSSAFEGSIARALIELGADVSFVASNNNPSRLSARASQNLIQRGLHLGRDVLPKVASIYDCDAGGHAGAAGMNGFNPDEIDSVLESCVDQVTIFIKSIEQKAN